MVLDADTMTKMNDFSETQIAAIAAAVAKAMPTPVVKTKATHNSLGLAGLVISILVFLGGGVGGWVSVNTQLSTGVSERIAIRQRLDALEANKQSVADSATKLSDLKESFDQFRLQYREDTRDLKQQVQDLQGQQGKK